MVKFLVELKFLLTSVYKNVKISFTGQLTLSTCRHVSCRWMWEGVKPMLHVKTSVCQVESDTRHVYIKLVNTQLHKLCNQLLQFLYNKIKPLSKC
jgi:hypothetical protein